MDSTVKSIIKPGMEGEFWKAMHRPANFFKHADYDADDILDGVQEEFNDGTLFLASLWYQDLGYQLTPEMRALVTWFTVLNPHLVNEDAPTKPLLQRAELEEFRNQTRSEKLETGKFLLRLARRWEHGT